jgi:hypothetical protein
MKGWLVVVAAVLLGALSACSIRVTGDASMLKKYDRPSDTWSMETKDGSAVKTEVAK